MNEPATKTVRDRRLRAGHRVTVGGRARRREAGGAWSPICALLPAARRPCIGHAVGDAVWWWRSTVRRRASRAGRGERARHRRGLGARRGRDATQPPLRPEAFDHVLVDAPCSGLGVLHRRADARWRIDRPTPRTWRRWPRRCSREAATLVRPAGYAHLQRVHHHSGRDVGRRRLGAPRAHRVRRA